MRSRALKRKTLADLECLDGKYNVGSLVTLDWPWVSREEAEEILDISNAEIDAILEYVLEMRD
jgi:hypothetical protein